MEILVVTILFGAVALAAALFFLFTQVLLPQKISTIQKLLRQGKYSQAVRIAQKMVNRDSRNSEAHYLLGMAYLQLNKPELALVELKTVNQLGIFTGVIDEIEFRKRIAELYLQFDQDEEALKEYILLIKARPHEAEYYFRAGQLFEKHSKTDQAHKYFRKTVEIDPTHSQAHLHLGMLLYRAKRDNEARGELEIALKFAPDNYEAAFYIGRILKDNKDFNGALAYFERSLKAPELRLKSLIERGICFLQLENLDRAIPEFERAIKQENTENLNEILHARYFLAYCYEKQRMFDDAIEQWEKIDAVKPNFKDVSEKLNLYADLRSDDKIKDYMTCSNAEFLQICTNLTVAQGLKVKEATEIPNGVQVIAIESDSEQWRNVKRMPKIIQYHRISENIDDNVLRPLADALQRMQGNRVVVVTNTGFTRSAYNYAENRPFTLIPKDGLVNLLKKVSWNRK